MRYFPLFADLAGADVLVAGGGEQAAQKVRLLRKTEARITVIAGRITPELEELRADGAIMVIARTARAEDVAGHRLVYAATGDRAVDAALFRAARARGIPVNAVDAPGLSTFITPAIVDRDPVLVAIGTEGTAPVLAREIKSRLERWLPANFGVLARRAQALRATIAKAVPDARSRRLLWERLLLGTFRRAVLQGRDAEADEVLAAELQGGSGPAKGRVSLIGCGPGDPDLLTLRALQRLQEADVLVVDRLVNPQILDYARRDAERIFVGKTPRKPGRSQAEINALLVREAAAGKIVARLKGGDPFIFGRAAEEMAVLQAAHIPFDVVPGVTAAHACAARIGLPVTLRDRVRQFSVITATASDGLPDLDWRTLAAPGAAFAVYMGVANAPLLRGNLLAAGADAATPVVIVERGTQPDERAVATTLRDLTDCIAQLGISGPAIIFAGLDWADAGLVRPEHVSIYRRPAGHRANQVRDAVEIAAEAVL